jgi:hypothetical protein
MLEAKRTLVKSAPELWAEVSDPGGLARHLAAFGSIRITQSRPDALVVWEGERATGTVRLEPSGFGTRVTLFAETAAAGAAEPSSIEAAAPARRGFWARLFRRRGAEAVPVVEPAAEAAAEPAGPEPIPDATALVVLTDMLDALGRAHHRPFSRV